MLAVEAARANGWDAKTEVAGLAPSGEAWQADVLAQRLSASVAVEVQWSSQVEEETLRRQTRYKDSNVRALWLLRQTTFPISQDVQAACIGGSLRDGFIALLPSAHGRMTRRERSKPDLWRQALPMDQFLSAAFAGRLEWGVPLDVFGDEATVEIIAAEADCEKCGVITDIITHIDICNPGMRLEFGLLDVGEHADLAEEVLQRLPASFERSHIKVRYSRTMRKRYLSNGCSGCDQLFGDFYMYQYSDAERMIAKFPVRLTGAWRRLAASHVEVKEAKPAW